MLQMIAYVRASERNRADYLSQALLDDIPACARHEGDPDVDYS